MSQTRRTILGRTESSDSNQQSPPPDKTGPLTAVTVHLIQQKLEPQQIAAIQSELEQLGATLVSEPTSADVVVTAITMRRRLERHIPWASAIVRDIVTTKWVEECARTNTRASAQRFAAIREPVVSTPARGMKRKLSEDISPVAEQDTETQTQQQTQTQVQTPPSSPVRARPRLSASPTLVAGPDQTLLAGSSCLLKPSSIRAIQLIQQQRTMTTSGANVYEFERPLPVPAALDPKELPPKDLLGDGDGKFSPFATSAVHRLHPMVCPNQGLIVELAVIRRQRELEGEVRSALSYSRAIAAIKAQPAKLKLTSKLDDIPYVGKKICDKIEQYLETGAIDEAVEYRNSERFQALSALTTIHGIGPKKAIELYDRGIRSLEECDRLYGVTVPDGYGNWIRNELLGTEGEDEIGQQDSVIREALALRDELNQKIPRHEVEKIAATIGQELEDIEPGCVWEICGGYRRGKLESNDVDIIFTHPEKRRVSGLCDRLVERLKASGMVTRSWNHLQTFHKPKSSSTPRIPGLDKSLLVLRLPGSTSSRRVDVIFANPDTFWTAIVGWTGSIMFERDLRLWAEKHGFKFNDSGIMRLRDSKMIYVRNEREVFDVLGLKFIEPRWRNADL